jgi:hypothetical protein
MSAAGDESGRREATTDTTGTIVGRVRWMGQPMEFANVILLGSRQGTLTDRDGWFRIVGVLPGSRTIQVQMVMCHKRTAAVDVRAGSTHTVSIDLHCIERGFQPNPDARSSVGRPCSVHRGIALALDTVSALCRHRSPSAVMDPVVMADSFPNARSGWDLGPDCDIGHPGFFEVAYCSACRDALRRWYERRN